MFLLFYKLSISIFFFLIVNRFDPSEAITHGVETLNPCEINVDVAKVGTGTWSLKTEEGAQAKMNGKWVNIHDFVDNV